MQKFIPAFFTFAMLLFIGCNQVQSQNTSLSAKEFAAKLKELPSAPIIDVRTVGEFSGGHIQNALNIDWNGDNFQTEVSKLDKSKPVFVYCLSGGRSSAAAAQMRADGFKQVYELTGGMMKWRAAGLPETTNSEAPKSAGMTKAQFDSLIVSNKTVLIDFYADWCAPCKKMKPYLDEISKEMAANVVVIRINADDNAALCKELGVDALPVLQVYKKGKMTWSYKGYIGKEEVVKQL